MAQRPAFFIENGKVKKKNYNFEWFSGFSKEQKQRSIDSLHRAIKANDPNAKALEISTKGKISLGNKLSAFNLKIGGVLLENIFQSSKVFENGGPYLDLLKLSPKEAKRDPRLRNSGKLVSFSYQGENFPLEPKSLFYDYIYLKAVKDSLSPVEIKSILHYNYFTDIEFNPKKSINTQARSIALVKIIVEEFGQIKEFNMEDFLDYHKAHVLE